MLVLQRYEGERIIVDGGRIVITLVSVMEGKARIGIDADRSIPIHREEIHQEIEREKKEARQ